MQLRYHPHPILSLFSFFPLLSSLTPQFNTGLHLPSPASGIFFLILFFFCLIDSIKVSFLRFHLTSITPQTTPNQSRPSGGVCLDELEANLITKVVIREFASTVVYSHYLVRQPFVAPTKGREIRHLADVIGIISRLHNYYFFGPSLAIKKLAPTRFSVNHWASQQTPTYNHNLSNFLGTIARFETRFHIIESQVTENHTKNSECQSF